MKRLSTIIFIISCILLFFTLITSTKADDDGLCLMTSNGFENGTNNFPTVKNSVPFYLDPQASSSLGTICPHLVGQKVCCNSTQVSTMVSRFTLLDATYVVLILCNSFNCYMNCTITFGI